MPFCTFNLVHLECWNSKGTPRIKKFEPDEEARKDAALLTALFAVIGAAIMIAYFLMLGIIFAAWASWVLA